jgi:hypothetical protein
MHSKRNGSMSTENTNRSRIKIPRTHAACDESKFIPKSKNCRKENCEKELAQIEKDLGKLSKNYIFVDYI